MNTEERVNELVILMKALQDKFAEKEIYFGEYELVKIAVSIQQLQALEHGLLANSPESVFSEIAEVIINTTTTTKL